MFIAVILAMIFAGVQNHPNGYDPSTPVVWHAWPQKGEKYVNIMSAVLNIVYTFVGQITYPSFISQMKQPRDFRKALVVVTICELITFALAGSIIYVYVGNAYMIAPAFGSLVGNFKRFHSVLHCQQFCSLVRCTVMCLPNFCFKRFSARVVYTEMKTLCWDGVFGLDSMVVCGSLPLLSLKLFHFSVTY